MDINNTRLAFKEVNGFEVEFSVQPKSQSLASKLMNVFNTETKSLSVRELYQTYINNSAKQGADPKNLEQLRNGLFTVHKTYGEHIFEANLTELQNDNFNRLLERFGQKAKKRIYTPSENYIRVGRIEENKKPCETVNVSTPGQNQVKAYPDTLPLEAYRERKIPSNLKIPGITHPSVAI